VALSRNYRGRLVALVFHDINGMLKGGGIDCYGDYSLGLFTFLKQSFPTFIRCPLNLI
jgi:hypothetical protein